MVLFSPNRFLLLISLIITLTIFPQQTFSQDTTTEETTETPTETTETPTDSTTQTTTETTETTASVTVRYFLEILPNKYNFLDFGFFNLIVY